MKKISNILGLLNKPPFLVWFFSLSAFLMRLIPWKNTIVEWGREFIFIQPDAYYHLRRATIWTKTFPRLTTLDYYMSYPYGAECPWAPLYDLFIAVVSLVIGGGVASPKTIGFITALLPPVIAALCVLPTYKLVKLLWNSERVALFAAFFAVLMPGMLGYSHIGSGDHHIAETFFSLWFFYFGVKALRSASSNEAHRSSSLLAGLMIALGLLVWQGEVVFHTLFCMYAVWLIVMHRENKDTMKRLAVSQLIIGALSAVIVAAVRFMIPRGTEQTLWDFGFFSYFQPSYVLLSSVIVYLLAVFLARGRSGKALAMDIGIALGASALIAMAIPPLRHNIIRGVKFIFKTDPWHSSINEFQTTFHFGMFWPIIDFHTILNYLYFLSFLLPGVFALLLLKRSVQERTHDAMDGSFYIFWGLVMGLFAFFQKRWNNAYSPALAIGIALLADVIYRKIRGGHGLFREFMQWREEQKGEKIGRVGRFLVFSEKFPFIIALSLMLFFITPYFYISRELLGGEGYPIQSDLYNSLVWIRNYTPKTSYLWEPDKKPEYSIIAPWDHGHFMQFIAERPTIVNNFGHQLRGDGFKDAAYIWSCETEEELTDIMNRHTARFIVVQDPLPYISNPINKYMKEGFLEKYVEEVPFHFGATMSTPKESFFTLPLARLMEFDGSATRFGPALKHYRLVFESKNPSNMPYHLNEVKHYKLIEYVKGVTVKGKVSPRAFVYFSAPFISNWDREFIWEGAAIADEKGNFSGTLPYATSEDNFFIKPLSAYIIVSGNKMIELNVSNEDVYKGKVITVDLQKGEALPPELKEIIKEKLKSSVGAPKSSSYINIHKKP